MCLKLSFQVSKKDHRVTNANIKQCSTMRYTITHVYSYIALHTYGSALMCMQGCIFWNLSFITSSSSTPSESSSSASWNNKIVTWKINILLGKKGQKMWTEWKWKCMIKKRKSNTLLKYFRGLGHKSSLIISATCNFGGKSKFGRH